MCEVRRSNLFSAVEAPMRSTMRRTQRGDPKRVPNDDTPSLARWIAAGDAR
jgi:hypothetical protein